MRRRARRRRRGPRLALALAIALAAWPGCAGLGPGAIAPREDPVRIADLGGQGDAARRASLRLITQGLGADAAGTPVLALSQYERALSIDPTNPFAYLALSRHYADAGDYERGLEYVGQAETLMVAEPDLSPRVEAHLAGLRGWALVGTGRAREGDPLLRRAAELAPSVWGDARLDPLELR